MYTGNKLAKFYENILSLNEYIAESFRGGGLFLTHTVNIVNFASIFIRTCLRCVRVFAVENPSVCTLSSVVCNVRAPYLAGWKFRQCFHAIWYLSHPLTSVQKFTEIVPGEPLCRGLNPIRGSQIQRFWTGRRLYLGNGARYGLAYNYRLGNNTVQSNSIPLHPLRWFWAPILGQCFCVWS